MTPIKLNSQDYIKNASTELASENKDLNVFDLPKISKVSINIGVGKFKEGKQKQEIEEYLCKLTGQKVKQVGTKKSIANFKTREGDIVGLVSTLRGKKAQDFLLNLIYVVLPRTRDFKGIKTSSFDKNFSSYSLGIENASIFPVVGFDTSVIFGMQINIVFDKQFENNKLLLTKLNFPFKK